MRKLMTATIAALLSLTSWVAVGEDAAPEGTPQPSNQTYSSDEIMSKGRDFFGATTEGLAKAVEKAFKEQGEPNGYILGEEGSGAFAVGLRYGKGTLHYKGGGELPIFWQGPSIGWDFGGNASKVLTLVYNLQTTDQLLQRYPGVEGSVYVVGGFGMNYQRSGDVTLAPIRTGVGLRAGANIGYLHYTLKKSLVPF